MPRADNCTHPPPIAHALVVTPGGGLLMFWAVGAPLKHKRQKIIA
jgi:hypothetical protein